MDWKRAIVILFWVQAGVNLVGALGPELSFDALWYHLPISRFIVERGWWGIIPGGLLYTSGIPRLIDFVNALLLAVGMWLELASPEILPKLLSYVTALGCAAMIYRLARRYAPPVYAWGAAAFWYANLVVGWQSIVVYVDLHRTFFTLVAIWFLIEWWEKRKTPAAIISGLFWGLAYSTKILGGIDLFVLAFVLVLRKRSISWELLGLFSIAGMLATFWGVLNLMQGYTFFYPLVGQSAYMPSRFPLNLSHVLSPFLEFFHPKLRTGPLILMPYVLGGWKAVHKLPEPVMWITMALLLSWWFAPAELWKGDGRYFLPALAMLAVCGASISQQLSLSKRNLVVGALLIQLAVGILYRGTANLKFVPVILGIERTEQFLARHLRFEASDWYDVDGWVGENLRDARYLVVGVHNTYYVPGKLWDHESWADSTSCYPYVLIQGDSQPRDAWQHVHTIERTRTTIYETDCF